MIALPLHIKPTDYSPEACALRAALHGLMASINPSGFRKPRTSRHRRHLPRFDRIDALRAIAKLKGKAAIAEFVKARGAR